jgi:hypothetical protein
LTSTSSRWRQRTQRRDGGQPSLEQSAEHHDLSHSAAAATTARAASPAKGICSTPPSLKAKPVSSSVSATACAHRRARLDADDPDFVGQHGPELAGKNPGAGTDIDDQIGARYLGDNGGKVRNQLIGVA